MRRYILLWLEGPMLSFGAAQGNALLSSTDIVSQVSGIPPGTGFLPGRPLLVGLIANALGFDRSEGHRHQALSDTLRFAAGVPQEPVLHDDFQTSQLGRDDAGWTTRGQPEGRRGGPATYESAYLRRKTCWADGAAAVALRLDGASAEELDDVGDALQRPERPLFIGRKAYPPASPVYRGRVDAADACAALATILPAAWGSVWDLGEGPDEADLVERDDRGWVRGVYQGSYRMRFRLPMPLDGSYV